MRLPRLGAARGAQRGGRGRLMLGALIPMLMMWLPFASAGAAAAPPPLQISVLSNRADLTSGGEALVAITLQAGVSPSTVRVLLNGANITNQFAVRPNGLFEGLVSGLVIGPNLLQAVLPSQHGAQITITDHPIGGPVFSGTQIQPWPCLSTPTPTDAQCNTPPTYTCVYMSTDPTKTGFQSTPCSTLPGDAATTTTDQGKTVPYMARTETGAEDRGQYQITTLYDPTRPDYAPWTSQDGWNHKLVAGMGQGCGVSHYEIADATSTLDTTALPRGFAVLSTALDITGHLCNSVLEAEALMMLKEHFIDEYGPVRYTISNGCSGGSMAQQLIANDYPGLLDGLQPSCSFPDMWATMMEVQDCALLLNYFGSTGAVQQGWTAAQETAVMGYQSTSPCQFWVNYFNYNQMGNPSNVGAPNSCLASSDASKVYSAQSNPNGVRCTLQDFMINEFGQRPASAWGPVEKQIGHGFAGVPWDTVGVQYGLGALLQGLLTPAQFVDLNANIGSYDIDYNFVPQSRAVADSQTLATAYKAGFVNEDNHMGRVAIIDLRGHDTVEIHEDYRSYSMRQRLFNSNGTSGNQIIWTGPIPFVATSMANQAFVEIDQWLAAVEADHSSLPIEQKIITDKPASATDKCFDETGTVIPNQSICQTLYPYYQAPRIVAGEPLSDDIVKCQLKPLSRTAYGTMQFTDAEWAQMEQIFPGGVCDWSKPSAGYVAAQPWLSFAGGPGGQSLGPAPASTSF